MIKDYETYHGAVFTKIISFCPKPLIISSYPNGSKAGYIIQESSEIPRSRKSTGLYIKFSKNRVSPWNFTFQQRHQEEMDKIKKDIGELFLALVCKYDGIVLLSYNELKQLLDDNFEPAEWISAKRRRAEKYQVQGKNGRLHHKIGDSDFPKKIFNYLYDS